jgi:subtilisin family serine protease
VRGWAEPVVDEHGAVHYNHEPHDDLFGHGTACAGIIHRIAPEAEIYSIRVLGRTLSGRGATFLAGLRWAIEQGMDVVNLSLGTTRPEFAAPLHELADAAYFQRTALVTAANNLPVASYPSLFATVVSVACYASAPEDDPLAFYCNPSPPVEFGAPGIDIRVAWLDGGMITATGNSFAAPHLTGVIALLRGKHPELTPAETKAVLRALARNARPVDRPG